MIYAKYVKRILDMILSLSAIIVLSPLLLILYLLVRVKLGSPVLFRQERPGRNGEIFTLCKFRTMTDKRNEKGELLPDEERLTGFGKMLRSTRHDVRPGLTGLAQVNGRNALGWEGRFAFDLEYVKHCSFVMDLKIIGMTVGKVLKRSGTLSGAEQTVEDFDVYRRKQAEENPKG